MIKIPPGKMLRIHPIIGFIVPQLRETGLKKAQYQPG
jgi:hypothetical protein